MMTLSMIMELLTSFGLPTALVIYFLCRDAKKHKEDREKENARKKEDKEREDSLVHQLRTLEEYQRDELMKMQKQTIEALATTAQASTNISQALNELRNHCLTRRES